MQILTLIAPFALVLVAISATPTNKRHICHEKENGVFLPMHGSCSGFYMCIDGGAIASSCGPFYRFNAASGVCDHPDLVQCNIATSNSAVDDDSNDFVWVMPMLPVMPTDDSTLDTVSAPGFPPHIPKPQSPEEVIADEAAGEICEHQRNGALIPKPNSCTHFYVCLLRRPYRRSCPPMLHFNAEKRLCQDPALAQCLVEPPKNAFALELAAFVGGAWSCAGMPNGILLPHNDSCEKFYNCEAGSRIEMDCPDGLHFSVRHQRCEWPKIARCSVE